MNDKNQTEEIKSAAADAVKSGINIKEEIRNITMEALSQKTLDTTRVREVAKAVMDGAVSGIDLNGAKVKESLDEVVSGLDSAFEQSAQATKLAIEETLSKVKNYQEVDLKHSLEQLQSLEELFMETLEEAAKASQSLLSDTFKDLIEHLKNTGTAVGQRTGEDMAQLKQQVLNAGENGVKTISDAAKSFTADVAQAASGFLQALADNLKDKDKPKS